MKSAAIGKNKTSIFTTDYHQDTDIRSHPLNGKSYYYPSQARYHKKEKNAVPSWSQFQLKGVADSIDCDDNVAGDILMGESDVQETSGSTKYNESWPNISPSLNADFEKSEMLSKEHSVEDFLAANEVVEESKDNDSTLARLVNRFRREPPQPRVERLKPQASKEFWWLKQSPSSSSTPIDESEDSLKFSPHTPVYRREKESLTTADNNSTTTTDRIQFRANRLLEMTDSTLSTKATLSNTSSAKTNNSEKPTRVHNNTSKGRNATTDESSLPNPLINGVIKTNNPWSKQPRPKNDKLHPEDDILYQWRLSRKMELANVKSKPNAFLTPRDNDIIPNQIANPLTPRDNAIIHNQIANPSLNDNEVQLRTQQKDLKDRSVENLSFLLNKPATNFPKERKKHKDNNADAGDSYYETKKSSNETNKSKKGVDNLNNFKLTDNSCQNNKTKEVYMSDSETIKNREDSCEPDIVPCKCSTKLIFFSKSKCNHSSEERSCSFDDENSCDFCLNNQLSTNKHVQKYIKGCTCYKERQKDNYCCNEHESGHSCFNQQNNCSCFKQKDYIYFKERQTDINYVPPHMHNMCDILPCINGKENSIHQFKTKYQQQCNHDNTSQHIPSDLYSSTSRKASAHEQIKNDKLLLMKTQKQLNVVNPSSSSKSKQDVKHVFTKQPLDKTAEKKIQKEHVSKDQISKVSPMINQVVANHIFEEANDDFEVKEVENVAIKVNEREVNNTAIEIDINSKQSNRSNFDGNLNREIPDNQPVDDMLSDQFEDDEILEELIKRRNIIQEKLKIVEALLSSN